MSIFLLVFIGIADMMAVENPARDSAASTIELRPVSFTIADSWFSRDKAHHLLTSAFLASAGYYFFRETRGVSDLKAQRAGVSFSISLGLLKEIRDGMQACNDFSWKDLAADCAGTALGILLIKN